MGAVKERMKRCPKCGWRGKTRQRRCKRGAAMSGWGGCGGVLVRVTPPRRSRAATRPQDEALRRQQHAQRMIAEKTRQMARIVTSLKEWMRKAERYGRRAAMSDADVADERARRAEAVRRRAARRVRRGIAFSKEEE